MHLVAMETVTDACFVCKGTGGKEGEPTNHHLTVLSQGLSKSDLQDMHTPLPQRPQTSCEAADDFLHYPAPQRPVSDPWHLACVILCSKPVLCILNSSMPGLYSLDAP